MDRLDAFELVRINGPGLVSSDVVELIARLLIRGVMDPGAEDTDDDVIWPVPVCPVPPSLNVGRGDL